MGVGGAGLGEGAAQGDRAVLVDGGGAGRQVGVGGGHVVGGNRGAGGAGQAESVGDGERGRVGTVVGIGVAGGQAARGGRAVAEVPGIGEGRNAPRLGAREGDDTAFVDGLGGAGIDNRSRVLGWGGGRGHVRGSGITRCVVGAHSVIVCGARVDADIFVRGDAATHAGKILEVVAIRRALNPEARGISGIRLPTQVNLG